jgi:nucleotide-binding universal stress UspA family protein
MRQQILVTLNGTKLGEAILPHALALARATHCGITLLRTITPPRSISAGLTTMVLPEDWYEQEEAWTSTYLNGLAGYIWEQEVGARVVMLDGDPATNILSYASQPEVLLIAMASHGREGMGRWFLGSISTQVIQAMPKPVIVMHPTSQEMVPSTVIPSYRNIIIHLDGTMRGERVLAFARPLIRTFNATVTLVQVEPTSTGQLQIGEGNAYIQRKAQQMRAAGVTTHTQIPTGDPSELVRKLSMQQRDVLVMAAQREKIEGLVMKFIHHVSAPVLVIPARC